MLDSQKNAILWFQKMLCFISSKTYKLRHHVSHQLNKVKLKFLIVCLGNF